MMEPNTISASAAAVVEVMAILAKPQPVPGLVLVILGAAILLLSTAVVVRDWPKRK